MCQQCLFSSNDGPDDDHNGSSMCTCRNCSFNATWGPTKQSDSLHAEEVPHASSSTWRRLFRGMKSSKLRRQVDSIRAECSSNGSWRCHRALPESLRCEHFAFTCFSCFFYLLRLATPALRLGVIAGSWLRSEAYVLPYWSAGITVIRRITLRVHFSSSSSTGSPRPLQRPLTPPVVEGRWPCRILAVHVSSSCTASSPRTLVHVAQSVPQVRAVPNCTARSVCI